MRILSIDSATKAMSLAICEEDKLIASAFLNVGKTHSQRLLPLLDDLLREGGLSLSEIDRLAVTVGPGSFTGVRIGISTAKAMAYALQKEVVPVYTLDALAYQAKGYSTVICPILDARKNEVYYGIYDREGQPLEPMGAKAPAALAAYLQENYGEAASVLFLGDGADPYFPIMQASLLQQAKLAPASIRMVLAMGAGFWALEHPEKVVSPMELQACYLRASEAEVQRQAKLAKEKEQQKGL